MQVEIEALALALLVERGADAQGLPPDPADGALDPAHAVEQARLLAQAAELSVAGRRPRRALIGPPHGPRALAHWHLRLRRELLSARRDRSPVVRELFACAFGPPGSWPIESSGRLARRAQALDPHPEARLALARARFAQGHRRPAARELDRVERQAAGSPLADVLALRVATTRAALFEGDGELAAALPLALAGVRGVEGRTYWGLVGLGMALALGEEDGVLDCLDRLTASCAALEPPAECARQWSDVRLDAHRLARAEVRAGVGDLRRRAPRWFRRGATPVRESLLASSPPDSALGRVLACVFAAARPAL